MSKTLTFKVFCMEQYKNAHRLSGAQTAHLFMQYHVLDYLTEFYDVLHTTSLAYVVNDIDLFIAARQ